MSRKVASVLALLALSAAPFVAADEASDSTVLDDSTFDDHIAGQDLTLVEFFAPWCGHCKALKPEWEAAATQLKDNEDVSLATVDCTEHRDLCGKFGVKGFPTVKLFRSDGSEPADYDQARKADAIVKYLEKKSAPAFVEFSSLEEAKAFAEKDDLTVLAFFDADAEGKDAYVEVAKKLRDSYQFGFVTDVPEVNAEYSVESFPTVQLFKPFDTPVVTYDGAIEEEEISKFLAGESFPLFGEIGPENFRQYVDRGTPLFWFFLDLENSADVQAAATEVAGEFKGEISFVKLDGERWSEHAKSYGLSGATPGAVLEDRTKGKNFVLDESLELTAETIRAHAAGVTDGSIAPTVKSEPVPESNDEPVTVIVGHTFDELVVDNDKDVLVEFYAPWCGHCKKLVPTYEELGEEYADDDNVVIAKIDATANDHSAKDVTGFPTLVFYGANGKTTPVKYSGDRSFDSLKDFIEENRASKPVEGHDEL